VLTAAGYTALLADTDNDPAKERTRFDALRGRQVDGFIVDTARRAHALLEEAATPGSRSSWSTARRTTRSTRGSPVTTPTACVWSWST
jgi:hypothetical protein